MQYSTFCSAFQGPRLPCIPVLAVLEACLMNDSGWME